MECLASCINILVAESDSEDKVFPGCPKLYTRWHSLKSSGNFPFRMKGTCSQSLTSGVRLLDLLKTTLGGCWGNSEKVWRALAMRSPLALCKMKLGFVKWAVQLDVLGWVAKWLFQKWLFFSGCWAFVCSLKSEALSSPLSLSLILFFFDMESWSLVSNKFEKSYWKLGQIKTSLTRSNLLPFTQGPPPRKVKWQSKFVSLLEVG